MNSRCFILPLGIGIPFVSNRWFNRTEIEINGKFRSNVFKFIFSNFFLISCDDLLPFLHQWIRYCFLFPDWVWIFILRKSCFVFHPEKNCFWLVTLHNKVVRRFNAVLWRHTYLSNVAKFLFELVFSSLPPIFCFWRFIKSGMD